MFDFLNSTRDQYPPEQLDILNTMTKEIYELQKVVDAMAKVYVAEHAKDIADRAYADKFYQTDQPIIDRAKQLELERQIKVAEMELRELKRKAGVNV